jgi:hypothetical protein
MINEILKETGKIKDDKELAKGFNIYLKGEKLETSIKEFWNGRENNNAAIKEKFNILLKQLSFFFIILQDINGFIKQSLDNKKDKDTIKQRTNACNKLYNKSLQTFIDMFGLLDNGSMMNSFLLWRSIYENYIIACYIAKGTEEEAKLFNDYETVQKNKLTGVKLTKEEKEKFAKKYGRDFESNDLCFAKNMKGKKTFIKFVRLAKEKRLYKYYLMSGYVGLSNAFSVNNSITYDPKTANKKIGFYDEEVTKSINAYINLLSEFANMMIENYIDDKKQKETVKKLVSHFGREIDRKWKKY